MTTLIKQRTFIDIFPTPQFLLLATSGISITDNDIKFIELKREMFGDGLKLVHAEKIDLPQGIIESGLIKETGKLSSILKDLSRRFNIRYTRVSLPEEKTYLFTVTIDSVSPENLKDAVAFIIEENVPISSTEAIFDYEIIEENKVAGKIKMAVSVLSKNVASSYIDTFESAGITPTSFDLESQSIARALIHGGDRRAQLIINLTLRRTGFYVVENKIVQFSTTSNYGTGEDNSYPYLNDLRAELHKVIAFWNARTDQLGKPDKEIKKIILCGDGALKKDFVDTFVGESGLDYVIADVWLNTSSSRDHISKMPFEESISCASPIGLALSNEKTSNV